MTAGDIASHFDMSQPSISHHLNLLKQAKLVLAEKQGQNIYYSLNETAIQESLRFFMDLADKIKK